MLELLTPFALSLHSALLVIIIGVELYRNRARRFDYLTLFSAAYLLNYALVPLVYDATGYSSLAVATHGLKKPPPFELNEAAIDIFFGYGVFVAGYFIGRDLVAARRSPICLSNRGHAVGFALGVAGVLSFFLYAMAYGGVFGLIKLAPFLRSGKKIAATALVSASKFMGLTAFGLWAAAANLRDRFTPQRIAWCIIYGAVAMLAAMATAGRTPMLVYFVPVIMLWATRGEAKIPLVTSILVIVALVFWVDWAKSLAHHLAGFDVGWKLQGGFGGKFLEDFYPTYTSVAAALEHYDSTGQMFGLADFGTAFIHLLPQHLLGMHITVRSSGNLNTALIGLTSGMGIPGLIAWSIYSLGPGWFLLWPFGYGILAGLLQSRYSPGKTGNGYAFCVYMGVGAFSSYTVVFDADPTVYLNTTVWLILGIVITEGWINVTEHKLGAERVSFGER